MSKVDYYEVQKQITEEIKNTLGQIKSSEVDSLLESIHSAEKVFFVGVGSR